MPDFRRPSSAPPRRRGATPPPWATQDDFPTFEREVDRWMASDGAVRPRLEDDAPPAGYFPEPEPVRPPMLDDAVYRRPAMSVAEKGLGAGRPPFSDMFMRDLDRGSVQPVLFQGIAKPQGGLRPVAPQRAGGG